MPAALLIIDMQKFVIDRIMQGTEYYPANCIENMQSLLEQFRMKKGRIIHIRHKALEEEAMLHEKSLFFPVIDSFQEQPGEVVFVKTTSSAFSSTNLLSYLQNNHISELVIIGAVAGFCVNSTARIAADFGFKVTVVKDAVMSFEMRDYHLSAKEILDVTLALLDADFAKVTTLKKLQIN